MGPDPDGDVVLKCRDEDPDITTSFRVSSKVLRLASPVFVRMLGPSFKEGQELLHADQVEINLDGDDATSMKTILDILHFKADSENHGFDAAELARLAMHSDKYNCTRALWPWVSTWFKSLVGKSQNDMDYGFQILAAYMFNDSKEFWEVSKIALENMTPGFPAVWAEENTLCFLSVNVLSRSAV
jgi:hypothetical protein